MPDKPSVTLTTNGSPSDNWVGFNHLDRMKWEVQKLYESGDVGGMVGRHEMDVSWLGLTTSPQTITEAEQQPMTTGFGSRQNEIAADEPSTYGELVRYVQQTHWGTGLVTGFMEAASDRELDIARINIAAAQRARGEDPTAMNWSEGTVRAALTRDFNPAEYIEARYPDWEDDPAITAAVTAGVLEGVSNHFTLDFRLDYYKMHTLPALEAAQRFSTSDHILGLVGHIGTDPSMFLIGAGYTKLFNLAMKNPAIGARAALLGVGGRPAPIMSKLGTHTVLGAGTGIGYEHFRNTLNPFTEGQGLTNELHAATFGAALGLGLPATGYALKGLGTNIVAPAWQGRKAQLAALRREDSLKILNEDPVWNSTNEPAWESIARGEPEAATAVGGRAGGPITMEAAFQETHGDIKRLLWATRGRRQARRDIGEGPTPPRPMPGDPPIAVSVLRPVRWFTDKKTGQRMMRFDERHTINKDLNRLRKRAKQQNLEIDVQPLKEAQLIYNEMTELQWLSRHPNGNAAATHAQLGQGAVAKVFGSLVTIAPRLQSRLTSGGRLHDLSYALFNDTYRTLSGSSGTVTSANARLPLTNPANAAAETIAGTYRNTTSKTLTQLRKVYQAARREAKRSGKPITHNGSDLQSNLASGRLEFEAAVMDHLRRRHARNQGFVVEEAGPSSPAIREAADLIENRLNDYGLDMVTAGLLDEGARTRGSYFPVVFSPDKIHTNGSAFEQALVAALKERDMIISNDAGIRGMAHGPDQVPIVPGIIQRMQNRLPDMDVDALIKDPSGHVVPVIKPRLGPDGKPIVEATEMSISRVTRRHGESPSRLHDLDAELAPNADANIVSKFERLTEGDLTPQGRAMYRQVRDHGYAEYASALRRHMTAPGGTGVMNGEALGAHFQNRVLNVNYTNLMPWMDDSVTHVIGRYDVGVSGRLSIARAIQLNKNVWQQYRLRETNARGNHKIERAEDLEQLVREQAGAEMDVAAKAGNADHAKTFGDFMFGKQRGGKYGTGAMRDLFEPMDVLMGTNSRFKGGFLTEATKLALRVTFMNKLGSVGWSMMNDFAPMTFYGAQHPVFFARSFVRNFIPILKNQNKETLELTGLWADSQARIRQSTDLDFAVEGGGDISRAAMTAQVVDRVTDEGSKIAARFSLMEHINDSMKRMAGDATFHELSKIAKKMVRARKLMSERGLSQEAAIKKVGLSKWKAAKGNKLGLNADTSRRYTELMYEHGIRYTDGKRLKDVYKTYDDFLRKENQLHLPNAGEWNLSGRANRDLYDMLLSNVHGEVNRHMVVTPGLWDKPLWNFGNGGKLINQFQTFGMAFVNQRLIPMGQMPLHMQAWYWGAYMMTGAITDAIANRLSGRRSWEDTAELWANNPMGGMYKAWSYSGLSGPIARVFGLTDAMGLGISPGVALNNITGGGAASARHFGDVGAQTLMAMGGPVGGYGGGILEMVSKAGRGEFDKYMAYRAATLMPFQNNVFLRLGYEAFDAPIVPKAILDKGRR